MSAEASKAATRDYIEAAWKDIIVGTPSEHDTEATLLRYISPTVEWQMNGNSMDFGQLVAFCMNSRATFADISIEVTNMVNSEQNGILQSSNRHLCHLKRKDGSTVSIECIQIIEVGQDGFYTKAVEVARTFDDSRDV